MTCAAQQCFQIEQSVTLEIVATACDQSLAGGTVEAIERITIEIDNGFHGNHSI